MSARTMPIASKVLLGLAAALAVLFVVMLFIDWHTFVTTPQLSAPYYVYILFRIAQCLGPAVILTAVALLLEIMARRRAGVTEPEPDEEPWELTPPEG